MSGPNREYHGGNRGPDYHCDSMSQVLHGSRFARPRASDVIALHIARSAPEWVKSQGRDPHDKVTRELPLEDNGGAFVVGGIQCGHQRDDYSVALKPGEGAIPSNAIHPGEAEDAYRRRDYDLSWWLLMVWVGVPIEAMAQRDEPLEPIPNDVVTRIAAGLYEEWDDEVPWLVLFLKEISDDEQAASGDFRFRGRA